MTAIRGFLFAGALFALIFTNAASAQTISIVQGDGQLICDGCAGGSYSFFDDLVVLVKDASGNPVSNAAVTWTVAAADQSSPPNGVLNSPTTVSGGNTNPNAALCASPPGSVADQLGYSCNRYSGNDTHALTHRVMAVTASLSNGQSVTFTLTEVPNASSAGATEENANYKVTGPPTTTQFMGTANSTSSTPITVTVFTNGGQAIPNVSVRLVPDAETPVGSPTANCATQAGADPGSVLTDATGTATCNVVFGAIPSTGTPLQPVYSRVLIGGVVTPEFSGQNSAALGLGGPVGYAAPLNGRFAVIVTPATANAVQIISGNNQSANQGQAFAKPLVIEVVDGSSPPIPLPSTPVTWSILPAGAAVITQSSSPTDTNGQASASVTLTPTAAGAVQVTATTANGKSATFNLTATLVVTITALTAVASTNHQSAPIGQPFPQPVSVQVTTGTGQTLQNIPVQFVVTSGSASLAQSSSVTGATGIAAVGVNAGNTPGPVVITATAGSLSATFTLTVTPPGLNLTYTNFLNGAGFFATDTGGSFSALSPCGIGTLVIGAPLTAATLPATPNLFAAALQQPSGASIVFNPSTSKESAPILNVTGINTAQTLITFQVPCDSTLNGTVPVSVTVNGASTLQPVGVVVRNASLGIFEIPMSDGVRRALLVHPDGTVVSLEQPARIGETIRMYVTGIGPTSPPMITGALPQVDTLSTSAYRAVALGTHGGIPVVTERVSPDLIGAYEMTFVVPSDAPTGDNVVLEVAIQVNSGEPLQFGQPAGSKVPIH